MLLTNGDIIIFCLMIIVICMLIYIKPKIDTEKSYNPLNYSQKKNNIYTYLDHKIFIQNPEMLKFIDSTLYFIDLNPPLYLKFIDELNNFYKHIWILNKSMVANDNVFLVNTQTLNIKYYWQTLLATFRQFILTMPAELYDDFESQEIVFKTILREQMNKVYDKVNHYNFNNKSLTRYSTNDLTYNENENDKVKNYELRQIN